MTPKRIHLNRAQNRSLEDWLIANFDSLKAARKTFAEAAEGATAALGFKCTARHVIRAGKVVNRRLPHNKSKGRYSTIALIKATRDLSRILGGLCLELGRTSDAADCQKLANSIGPEPE